MTTLSGITEGGSVMSKDYKKQEELCKKLGAEKFQKVVFEVENIKYKLIYLVATNSRKT